MDSEQSLLQRIQDLTTDIGSVLHANTSTLVMVGRSVEIAIRALGPNPFPGENSLPPNDEIDAAMDDPAHETATELEKLLALLDEKERRDALPEMLRGELEDCVPILRDFRSHVPIEESRASTLRTVACRIQDVIRMVKPKRLPREILRGLTTASGRLERITALISLLQARVAILQMDYTIRSLREFITADLRQAEQNKRLKVVDIIRTAHQQLADFSDGSGVEIRRNVEAEEAEIVGQERELVRAFGNLLHNAVKYSWRRVRGESPWVTVTLSSIRRQNLCIFRELGCSDQRGRDRERSRLSPRLPRQVVSRPRPPRYRNRFDRCA